jgi:agmatinase
MKTQSLSPFLDLQSPYNSSKVVIQSIPYERTTSYLKGTGKAPLEILRASREVEFYDEESMQLTYKIGIHTLKPYNIKGKGEKALSGITSSTEKLLKDKKFIVTLGGEHTITPFIVRAHTRFFKDLSVLVIDAHADLRNEYQGTIYSHACASYLTRKFAPIVEVGVRALSVEEANLIRDEKIPVFYDFVVQKNKNWIKNVLKCLSNNVYVSVDFDGLEPSLMPAVGTPVPGGISWWQTIELLRRVADKKNIVGMDFVELCPAINAPQAIFAAAKLIYKAIGYVFRKNL